MSMDHMRQQMNAFHRAVNEEALRLKDSYFALQRLHQWYESLATSEQTLAKQVIAEWALSHDEARRFDALVLIEDYCIDNAISALIALAERLEGSREPGAPYELAKVHRILNSLAGC